MLFVWGNQHKIIDIKTNEVLYIKTKGRGSHCRTNLDKHGFPRGYLSRQKFFFGFQTGDIVKAIVPNGKYQGTWMKETHHSYYLLFVNGKKTSVRTRLSHGSSEYGSNLLSMIKKQLSLETTEELEDFINCPMSWEAYVELLLKRNVIKL